MILLESEHEWSAGPLKFPAGRWYVEGATAGSALYMDGRVKVQTVDPERFRKKGGLQVGQKVLLCRSGGFGDILFMTPLIRAMDAWGLKVDVAVTPYYRDVLSGNPYVNQLVDYPVPAGVEEEYCHVYWFEGLMEWTELAEQMHVVDLLAMHAGVELTAGRHLDFYVEERWQEAMRLRYPKGKRPRVGVQLRASALCRSYPISLLQQVLLEVIKVADVVLFGEPMNDAGGEPLEGLLSLPHEKPALSFGESAAVLSTCDVVIAPDSALCHVAGALGIPTIALYGSFPHELRTAYAMSVKPLQGQSKAKCGPCFWHDREGPFPEWGPCAKTGRCEALAAIAPGRIIAAVRRALGERGGAAAQRLR